MGENKIKKMKFECYKYFFAGLFGNESKKEFFNQIQKHEDIEFNCNKIDYFYKFLEARDNIVLGLFAKKSNINLKPDKSLQERGYTNYIECYIAFNINTNFEDDKDSQTIYMQYKTKFSQNNLEIITKFTQKVTRDISVNVVNEDNENKFWNLVEKTIVKKLTLEICPPNLFGHKNALVLEANEAKEKHKAKRYKQAIETDDEEGLNLKQPSKELKEGVEYCMSGGGSVIAIGKDGKTPVFNSKTNIKIKQLEIKVDPNTKDSEIYANIIDKFLNQ
jgi:hypothetical protein